MSECEDDMVPRESGCQCQWEIGDRHCPVHPNDGCTFCSEIRKQFLADKAGTFPPRRKEGV